MPTLQAQRHLPNADSSSASRGARGAQEERPKTMPLVPWLATDATPGGRDLYGMLKPQSSLLKQQQPAAESGGATSVRRRLFGPCCREELDAWFAKHESQLDHMPPHWRIKVSSKARSQVARRLVVARHLEGPWEC